MGRCSKLACCFIFLYATLLHMLSDCHVSATPQTTSQQAGNDMESNSGTCNSQFLIRYIFCEHGFKSGRQARFLMDGIERIHPAGGPTPEEIQIDSSPLASKNVTDSSGDHRTHGIRPTAAAGILFAILFAAVCAALFCFIYGPTEKDSTRVDNNSNSACTRSNQSHAIHVQRG